MSPEGYSRQCSCEPFTATQAEQSPTPFPPSGAEGGRGAGQGKGSGLVLWEGESTCSLICWSSPLVWERRTTCWVTMRVLNPKVLDLQRPRPFREGRTSLKLCQPAARVPRACRGGCVGLVSHSVPLPLGGQGGSKRSAPLFPGPQQGTSPRPAPSLCGG